MAVIVAGVGAAVVGLRAPSPGNGDAPDVNGVMLADGTVLDQKTVGADGKEMSMHVTIKYDGKDHPVTGNPDADTVAAKALDAHTSHFTMKKDGKVVGTVHRVVSADGKTLTVNNKGTHADGKAYDDAYPERIRQTIY